MGRALRVLSTASFDRCTASASVRRSTTVPPARTTCVRSPVRVSQVKSSQVSSELTENHGWCTCDRNKLEGWYSNEQYTSQNCACEQPIRPAAESTEGAGETLQGGGDAIYGRGRAFCCQSCPAATVTYISGPQRPPGCTATPGSHQPSHHHRDPLGINRDEKTNRDGNTTANILIAFVTSFTAGNLRNAGQDEDGR